MFAKKIDPLPKAEAANDSSSWTVESTRPYGIADVMSLMRSLPNDANVDLMVRVVRVTLNSVDVRFEDIIADATQRQQSLEETVATLRQRIGDLEGQIEGRKRDIAAYEADLKETSFVKERLQAAIKGANQTPASVSASGAALAQSQSGGSRVRLPKPARRDESGEIPDIIDEITIELAAERPRPTGRR
jgi:hypothetical protein